MIGGSIVLFLASYCEAWIVIPIHRLIVIPLFVFDRKKFNLTAATQPRSTNHSRYKINPHVPQFIQKQRCSDAAPALRQAMLEFRFNNFFSSIRLCH